MSSFTAEWYDQAMTGPDEPAMLPLEDSPWLDVYEALAREITDPYDEVVDLGCGTGRFLELLRRRGHMGKMTGVDWSAAALAEAEHYVRGFVQLQNTDLDDWEADPERASNTVFVCSEVLEHLQEDIDLVRRIPPGSPFLFSVPNFHSESHLRVFTQVGDLWRRYAELLQFCSWRMIGDDQKGIHVVESLRRADSW